MIEEEQGDLGEGDGTFFLRGWLPCLSGRNQGKPDIHTVGRKYVKN